MRKDIAPWVVGSVLGFLGAVASWASAHRETMRRRRVTADLSARIIALEEQVEQAHAEAKSQKRLADQRRAELSDALAREERLRAEFAALEDRLAEAGASARAEEQLALFERLAALLVQLPTVQQAVAEGNAVSAGDVLALLEPLSHAMSDMGFVPIGEPGDEVAFDPRLHQLAPGGACADLEAGQPARVKVVGFRRGEHILRRAQVAPA